MTNLLANNMAPATARPVCSMPYYPDTGVDHVAHNQDAQCKFYVVSRGRIPATYTSADAANAQTLGFRNAAQQACNHWTKANTLWSAHCLRDHGTTCPDALVNPGAAPISVPSSAPPPPSATPAASVYFTSQTATASPTKTPSRPPTTMSTRIHLALHLMPATSANADISVPIKLFWGVPGIMRAFESREDALATAHAKNIEGPTIIGPTAKRVVEAAVVAER
ncbi:hypothetical protein DFH07DRAFT_772426 [Mycena maculata]|uniref:Uncharacterized protein n=1 Tax=Mycena maculata TaxID=230809 RepID=A0AAD7NG53_9AGAR|nr:hypothetical protein DFH07DRAFT_772426 [Mycena maculata]